MGDPGDYSSGYSAQYSVPPPAMASGDNSYSGSGQGYQSSYSAGQNQDWNQQSSGGGNSYGGSQQGGNYGQSYDSNYGSSGYDRSNSSNYNVSGGDRGSSYYGGGDRGSSNYGGDRDRGDRQGYSGGGNGDRGGYGGGDRSYNRDGGTRDGGYGWVSSLLFVMYGNTEESTQLKPSHFEQGICGCN